jgi:hypothetical protein
VSDWGLASLSGYAGGFGVKNQKYKRSRSLKLQDNHAKTLYDICKKNNVYTIEQALACKEL